MAVLIVGALLGVSAAIFTVTSLYYGLLLIGLLVAPVCLHKSFTHRMAWTLFVLFLSFGIMNTAIKPFDLLFVIVAGVFFILKKHKLQRLRDLRFINSAFVLFMVISLLSVINSNDVRLGFSYYIHTLFMMAIFYFLAIMIRTKKEFKSILLGYISTVLFSALAVIAQKFGMIGDLGTWFQGIRAQGFFIDPNDFSPFLILAIVLLLEKAFTYHYLSIRYFAFCFLAVVVSLTLLAAMSRAAFLNLIIVMLIYLFYSSTYRKRYGQTVMLFATMIFISVVSMMMAGDSITHYLSIRFFGSTDILQAYDADRFFFQRQGMILGFTHLFGIGPGQFEYHFGYATHNLFIRIIAENGWIAFFSFAAVSAYFLKLLFFFRKRNVWNLPVYLFLSVYIGILVNSFFLDTLHWRYLWFYLGLCTIMINQAALSQKKEEMTAT